MGGKTTDMGMEGVREDRLSRPRSAGLLYNSYTPHSLHRSAHDG